MKHSFIIKYLVLLISIVVLHSCQKEGFPVLSTLEVTNITAISALSGGNITSDGGSAIISKGVCWSTDSGPTLNGQKTNDGTGSNNFNSIITGLKRNANYYVRAYATNKTGTSYGNEILFNTLSHSKSQIIADHTIVDRFVDIPEEYLNKIKKMMICFPGESHSYAFRVGMELLELMYPSYSCNVGTEQEYTDQYLRIDERFSAGEAEWFTWYAWPNPPSPIKDEIKNMIKSYYDDGNPFSVVGFGWCWDLDAGNTVSSKADPFYECRWYGRTDGGPDGLLCFGLDAEDFSITGNRVSMDTYIAATEDYITFCTANGYPTKVIFTTGPLQNIKERGYQGYLKLEHIRNYVAADSSRILFDYHDILCFDNAGVLTTTTWEGHTYPVISSENSTPEEIGHISNIGAIRLAKAQWWMLARIAGWDGVQGAPVKGITVTGEGGASVISTDNGTLQLSAVVTPDDATEQILTWTILNGTGHAIISATGLVTAIASGTVTAQAMINDGSGVTGTMDITIYNRNIADQLVVIVKQTELIFPLDESFLDCKISLYNLYGNLMTARLVNSDISVFDVTGYRPGLYIAVLSNNLILRVAKVILP
jgi:hypothetical protein